MEYLERVSGLIHEEGMRNYIQDVKTLMRWHRIDYSRAARPRDWAGNFMDRVAKTLTIGKNQKSEIELKVAKIRDDIRDFLNKRNPDAVRTYINTAAKVMK